MYQETHPFYKHAFIQTWTLSEIRVDSDTFCVQDNDAVLRGPGYTRPAEADYTPQRLHNSQVGHPPYWLTL